MECHPRGGRETPWREQPRLNDLLRGRVGKFSLDALLALAARAGLVVHLEVTFGGIRVPHREQRRNALRCSALRLLPGGERISASRAAKGEREIWHRRYWEHTVRDENDFTPPLDFIHFNPAKHGHTIRPRDWPYSSFRLWVRLGASPLDWAEDAGYESTGFGER